ncbi:MAG: 30S ribosomal protein S12 methylthiotransferase RimO [Marinilabiliales bacterium]|nr:MAG: 30S ribosomal protein S12 methylthiotransferase RimO [Marinilabiliales bacterium]
MSPVKNFRRVNMITMGCSKNLVDSEFLMAQFSASGWKVDFDGSGAGYDAVIINTCGFIHDARQESVDMILQYARAREKGEIGKLFVTGCLSERYKDELAEEIPEADLILGVDPLEGLKRELKLSDSGCSPAARLLSTPSHYAYLKISEGCDRKCSFCTIPSIRGRHLSRRIESLVDETKMLSEKGVKELVLIAQDLTSYGTDLYGEPRLGDLLLQLQEINGIEWIRLHYAYPAGFPDDVLEIMASGSKICRYLDIPLQHISDNVLKKMRRGISGRKTLGLIKKIRNKVPGIALRTTLLTGHPGESGRDFEDLKNFVRSVRFERLGVFPYSHEEGTWAYNNLEDSIPLAEKERRAEEIMEIQQEISTEINSSYIGRHIKVLIDSEDEKYFQGRTEHDSPEVDNGVLIEKTGSIVAGSFILAEVTGADEFDLYARPLL